MSEKKTQAKQADDLRKRAQEITREKAAGMPETLLRKRAREIAREKAPAMPENLQALSPEDARLLLHELRVHQIELEMQNEELRRMQSELEASRIRYFDLYDLAPVGYFTISEQGLILEGNLTAAGLLGVSRSALVKRRLTAFVLPEDQDVYYGLRKQLFETGAPQVCELRMLRANAAPFWVQIGATVAQDADGAPMCRVVVSDITDRKRAETALRESESRYRRLHETMTDCFVQTNMTGEIVGVNKSYLDVLGYSEEEVKKLRYQDVTSERWHKFEQSIVETQILPRGYSDVYEKEYIKKDGTVFPVELRTYLLRDAQGHPVGMWAIVRDITERKRAEDEVRRINAAIDAAGDAVGMATADGHHFYQNEAFDRLFGYNVEEVSFLEPAKLYANEDDAKKVFGTIMAGESWSGEIEMVAKDGRRFPVLLRADAVKDDSGKVTGLVGVHTDITERRRAEEALRESEERLRDIIFSIADWVWEVDQNGAYTYSSQKGFDLLGRSHEEVIGKTPFDFMPPDEARRVGPIFSEIVANRAPIQDLENWNIRKDGRRICLLTNGVPILDKDGNLKGYRGVDQDITERKRAVQALWQFAERRASLSVLLQGDVFAAGSLDEKLRQVTDAVVRVFDADFCRIWVTKPGDLCGAGCVHAEVTEGPHVCLDRDRCLCLVASSGRYTHIDGLMHRRVPFGCYKIGRVAAGQDRGFLTNDVTHDPRVHNQDWARELGLVSFAGYRLTSSKGEPIGVLALFSKQPISPDEDTLLDGLAINCSHMIQIARAQNDLKERNEDLQKEIAEHRQAEERIGQLNEDLEQRVIDRTAQLQATNEELEAFSYSVSHDLRAPLRALDGFSRIVLDDYASFLPEEALSHLNRICAGALQMGRLIDDLLEFSRLGRQPVTKQSVKPGDLVQEVWENLAGERLSRNVKLSVGEMPDCQADPALLRQVYSNLLYNALKFTRHREVATIEVGCTRAVESADTADSERLDGPVYFVRDNGVGFDMQFADKLFRVFQRFHRPEEYEGTGVGLAIVQRVIARHGGRVWAHAELDKGATFYFTLGSEVANQLTGAATTF